MIDVAHYKRLIRKVIASIRRIELKNRDFTIISNNCCGGFIYDIYRLKYKTPTIGCVIFPDQYCKFVSNLDYYLSKEIKVLNANKSCHLKIINKLNLPKQIGIIDDDIEVCFVHYRSADEGCKKLNKRKERVNKNNLLVKFNDQNGCLIENYEEFKKLNVKNKLFFTSNEHMNASSFSIMFKKFKDKGYVVDDIKTSLKEINIKEILNNLLIKEEIGHDYK